jgi:hypothetical protein
VGAEKDEFGARAAFSARTAFRAGTACRPGATLGASEPFGTEPAFGADIWTFRNRPGTHDDRKYKSPEHIDDGPAGHDGYDWQAGH